MPLTRLCKNFLGRIFVCLCLCLCVFVCFGPPPEFQSKNSISDTGRRKSQGMVHTVFPYVVFSRHRSVSDREVSEDVLGTRPSSSSTSRQRRGRSNLDSSSSVTSPPMMSSSIPDTVFGVKAFFCARKVDFVSLFQSVYSHRPHSLQKDSLIVKFRDEEHEMLSQTLGHVDLRPHSPDKFMIVFGYGSVVFVNFEEWRQKEALDMVRKFAVEPLSVPKAEDYAILLRPHLATWSEQSHDYIIVRKLDLNNLLVISGILGQTVALDYYEKKVDGMLETFSLLNSEVERTGRFAMGRRRLFTLVAENNGILTDVITKLGILDRSEIPWKYSQYASVWESMRDEFELEERFKNFDFKLNLIQHNNKFFLEMLHNQKSSKLEWIIIALIAVEVLISVGTHFADHLLPSQS